MLRDILLITLTTTYYVDIYSVSLNLQIHLKSIMKEVSRENPNGAFQS